MLTLGVSAGFHDAGLTVVEDGEICFAAHSERYSKKKHDKDLCEDIINQANSYMDGYGPFDAIGFYETPWLKKTRELYAGQGMFGDRSSTWTTRGALKKQFGKLLPKTHAIKTYRPVSYTHLTLPTK